MGGGGGANGIIKMYLFMSLHRHRRVVPQTLADDLIQVRQLGDGGVPDLVARWQQIVNLSDQSLLCIRVSCQEVGREDKQGFGRIVACDEERGCLKGEGKNIRCIGCVNNSPTE